MGRFFIGLGIIIELVVIGLLVGGLTGIGGLNVMASVVVDPFVCGADEFITTTPDNGYSCIDMMYVERDVTSNALQYLVGGAVLGIIIGAIFINIGGSRLREQRHTQQMFQNENWAEVYQDGIRTNIEELKTAQASIPPEAQAIMREVLGQLSGAFDMGSLAERLQELEDAKQKGLITQAEYDRVRQAILDSMDD